MAQAAFHRASFQNTARPNHSNLGPIPRAAWIESHESQLPPKPDIACCPHCLQEFEAGRHTTLHRIQWAVVQLVTAVVAIIFCALRLARLAVAVAFSMIGVVGFGMQTIGSKIAHPDDRRLLPRLGRSQ